MTTLSSEEQEIADTFEFFFVHPIMIALPYCSDGLLQAKDGKRLFDDCEMLVNDGEMSIRSYSHFTIID